MKRLLFSISIVLGLLASASIARAEWGFVAFEKVSATSASAVTLTTSTIPTSPFVKDSVRALITCEGYDVRFRMDGGTPTATNGHLLKAGSAVIITGYGNLMHAKFLGTSGSTSDLQTSYEVNK